MSAPSNSLDPLSLGRRLLAPSFLRRVEVHSELPSTNDLALARARCSELPETPCLFLARQQSQGRGREGRVWVSSAGGLTFSILVEAQRLVPRNANGESLGHVSVWTALAIAETLAELHPTQQPQVKWPNDVLLNRRKIAGILIESAATPPGYVVVGIGLNVNNQVPEFIEPVGSENRPYARATSLRHESSHDWELADVLIALVARLEAFWLRDRPTGNALVARWRQRCALKDSLVTISQGTSTALGRCMGIDGDGGLILLTENGPRTIFSGTVGRPENRSPEF